MSKHIVFVWELGGGYGHLSGFLPLARELCRAGCRVTLVLRDLSIVSRFALPEGCQVMQAPLWIAPPPAGPAVANFAELLFLHGYRDAPGLQGVVQAWRDLLKLLAPDLLIIDHAPTALLASRGSGVPRALFSTGFCIPPQSQPWPSLRPGEMIAAQRLRDADAQVLDCVNQVLQKLGATTIPEPSALYEVEETFLCTFPELDHYRNRGPAPYWGPRMEINAGLVPTWPGQRQRRVLAYLKKGHPGTAVLLAALAKIDCSAVVHIPGGDPALTPAANVQIAPAPLHMAHGCAEADLVLCHGGHGTVSVALLAGCPVATMPAQLEQHILAENLRMQGLGAHLQPGTDVATCINVINALLVKEDYRQGAAQFATRYRDFDPTEQMTLMGERCLELAGI